MSIVDVAVGSATMHVPWDGRFLGDEPTGLVHGGVLTTLLDATCGLAAFMGMVEPGSIATLDLRIDHLRAATAGLAFEASATVVRASRQVLFVRGTVHQLLDEGAASPTVAVATATFAVTT